jgi:hypothetical protein
MTEVHGIDRRDFYDRSVLDYYDPHKDFGYAFDQWWHEYEDNLLNGHKRFEARLQELGF